MVIQKRLDYGFTGYQVPAIPRASRSARKRSMIQKNQMHAFDLLATVAGKLLSGEDTHPTFSDISNGKEENAIVKKEQLDDDKPLKSEAHDQGQSDGTFVVSNLVYENRDQDCGPKGHSAATFADKVANDLNENEMDREKSGNYNVDCKSKLKIEDSQGDAEEVLTSSSIDGCKLEEPSVKEQKPCEPTYSKISSKVPLCRNHSTQICYPGIWDNTKVDGRDDDENSSGCTHLKSLRSGPYIGGQRIRKILASKMWKVTKKYRDETIYNVGGNSNFIHNYQKRKNYYKRQRTQMNVPFKKRKLFDSSSLEKATGTLSSVANRHPSFKSRDSYVKLRITSFRVPEIFFEIPETATVGSLKRRVMETVASILGGELHVGVLVRGKKVRDDNKTLFQSGISRNDQLGSLGFTLEPHSLQTPTSFCCGNSPCRLPCNKPEPLPGYPTSAAVENLHSEDVLILGPHLANLGSSVESNHDSALSPIHISLDKITTSKALVSVPAMAVEALAVVPMHRKPKRPEGMPRRIRRPFTVAEVEALVQAVERLGTGRWRDVKLRAFDSAKHRTYVDLKDKWKTLVHTARISPQQRRGEPVPQELLDRVLNAHDYWSQPQHHTHQALPSSPLKAF